MLQSAGARVKLISYLVILANDRAMTTSASLILVHVRKAQIIEPLTVAFALLQ